jgi:nucleotide-binding universal stress UspA family protein
MTDYTPPEALDKARAYLAERDAHDVTFVLREKPIAAAILDTAVSHHINFLVMGGFGFRPVKHLMLGSTVDELLRRFRHPLLICR